MNMLSIIPIFLFASLLIPIASAQTDTFVQCISNDTLNVFEFDERCINGKCDDYSTNKTVFCFNGCDLENNRCNPEQFDATLIAIGFMVGLVIILVVFLKVVK